MVKTRQGSLRCGYGVEAAMWYAHEPEEGNYLPIVIDFLPRGSFLEVLVCEDVQDNEAEHTLGRFGNADSLRAAVDNFLVNFVARAKGYLEVVCDHIVEFVTLNQRVMRDVDAG